MASQEAYFYMKINFINTWADDIPLGALGGTCMELTFGGSPSKWQQYIIKKKECGPHISKLEAVHKDEPPFGCFKHSVLHQAKFLNSKVYHWRVSLVSFASLQ